MSEVALLFNGTVTRFPSLPLRQFCPKFPTGRLTSPYPVRSNVSSDIFKLFLSAVNGEQIEITKANFSGLSALSNEFGFELKGPSYRLTQVEFAIDELRGKIDHLSNQITEIKRRPSGPVQLSESISQLRSDLSGLWRFPKPPRLESLIISDFPIVFSEFRGKTFTLLWRGTRDGFGAKKFHRRCDGHEDTLTVILDTKGNIFGGFTPVNWESGNDRYKEDESQKTFLFTIKNPHDIGERRFRVKEEKKYKAIRCYSRFGPAFTGGILVADKCNVNTKSWTELGNCYVNDTGLDKYEVFTGSFHFRVAEIEIFEIID